MEPNPQLPGGLGGSGRGGTALGGALTRRPQRFGAFWGVFGVGGQAVFRKFDLDKSGSMSAYEMRMALEAAGNAALINSGLVKPRPRHLPQAFGVTGFFLFSHKRV